MYNTCRDFKREVFKKASSLRLLFLLVLAGREGLLLSGFISHWTHWWLVIKCFWSKGNHTICIWTLYGSCDQMENLPYIYTSYSITNATHSYTNNTHPRAIKVSGRWLIYLIRIHAWTAIREVLSPFLLRGYYLTAMRSFTCSWGTNKCYPWNFYGPEQTPLPLVATRVLDNILVTIGLYLVLQALFWV